MDAEQMIQPPKRAALLLGFIKGPNVNDWFQLRTDEMLDRYNRDVDPNDPIYWDDLGQKFMQAFNNTASRERAEEKLQHLTWIPGDVDTFLAQFRTLANQAQYPLSAKPTITLFASKLPFKMMQHIYMVVKPHDFNGWTDAARQYHQDNTTVQNVRGIYEENPKKAFTNKKTGFSAKQWAQILRVKMPVPDPDKMDTCADRSRSYSNLRNKKKTLGCVSTTKEDPETQHKEGHCFTCNKQGHLARNCPDKTTKKHKTKACTAKVADSENETITETPTQELDPETYVRLGKLLKEEEKLTILKMAIEAEKGAKGENMDF
jgi:hypothetical protein